MALAKCHCFTAYFFDYNLTEKNFYSEKFSEENYSFKMAYDKFFDNLFSKFEFPIQSLTFNYYFQESPVREL